MLAIAALSGASLHCSGSDATPVDDDTQSTGGSSASAGSSGASSSGGADASGGANASGGSAGGEGEESQATEASFAQVRAILSESCSKCHSGTNTHVDLRDDEGLYARLTTELGGETKCANFTLVVPGDVEASVLVGITSPVATPPCSVRMPNKCSTTGSDPRSCLSDAQVAVISQWIEAGALE